MTYAIGAIAWLVWAFLPGKDPSRYAFSVSSAVVLGMSQIAGVVLVGTAPCFPSLRRQRFGSRSAWSLEQERA
jgi:hypothetical protein